MASEVSVRVLKTVPELEEVRPSWESWPGNRDSEIETYLMCNRCQRTIGRTL